MLAGVTLRDIHRINASKSICTDHSSDGSPAGEVVLHSNRQNLTIQYAVQLTHLE